LTVLFLLSIATLAEQSQKANSSFTEIEKTYELNVNDLDPVIG
jgi:hypothetical protein